MCCILATELNLKTTCDVERVTTSLILNNKPIKKDEETDSQSTILLFNI